MLLIFHRLEKLNWSVAEGKAKVMGTAIGISGAMLMTFYNGAEINIGSSNINLLHAHRNQNGHMEPQHADFSNKPLGVLCAIGSSCFFSLWFIIQVSYRVMLTSVLRSCKFNLHKFKNANDTPQISRVLVPTNLIFNKH